MVLVGGIVRVDFTPVHVRGEGKEGEGKGKEGEGEGGREGGRRKRGGECMQLFHFIIHFT